MCLTSFMQWNLTSVVSTLTGSVYFSVAVPSAEEKQMLRHFLFCVKKYHTHIFATVFLVTRFGMWLFPSLRISHCGLLLLFLFLLTCPILMSLCSVKVTTQQHFVQSVPQCLVWYKDGMTSKKTKSWLNGVHLLLITYSTVFLWWNQKPLKYLHVVPATALSRPSSSSHKCSEASSYCSVNLQVTQEGKYTIWWCTIGPVAI